MKIYKYKLEITDVQKVKLPVGSKILSVGEQFNDVYLWCLVDPENGIEERAVYIFGTGNLLPTFVGRLSFIGTVMTDSGNYVWHVYE